MSTTTIQDVKRKERATVQLTDSAKAEIEAAAAALGMTVPDYIRRALALSRTLDRYTHDGMLTVVDRRETTDGETIEERVHVTALA